MVAPADPFAQDLNTVPLNSAAPDNSGQPPPITYVDPKTKKVYLWIPGDPLSGTSGHWADSGTVPKYAVDPSSVTGAVGLGRNAINQAHYNNQDALAKLTQAADAAYQRGQLNNNLYHEQAVGGQALLDQLTKLMQDPTAGALGLSAFARYGGGAQNVAAGTGGAGIANPNASLYDTLLKALSGEVAPGTQFSQINAGGDPTQLGTAGTPKVDPNKAPAPTPEAAAQAPNEAQNWQDAWKAFNPGKMLGVDQGIQYPTPGAPAPTPAPVGYASGGTDSMTIGGEPHYIVDSKGNTVANLTEDGKPETVKGMGGVEVIPEDPARKAAYLESKAAGQQLGQMVGEMMYPSIKQPTATAAPAMATGGAALFPQIPNSDVNTQEPGGGSGMLPSAGGPGYDRMAAIGSYFKPTSTQPLPTEATAPDFNTRLTGYAKLLGSAFSSGNTAVPLDTARSLNAGKAPNQLLSSSVLGTLLPSQRQNYFSLLQQMGLGTPADNQYQINRFTPTSLNSPAVAP